MASGSREQFVINYPDVDNIELPHLIECMHETQPDEAKSGFLRICFAEVTIDNVVGFKRNCQPSGVWRVSYQMKNRTPNYCEKDSKSKKAIYPFPDSQEQLKKLFIDITKISTFVGVNVLQKHYTYNREFAVVDYSPMFCSCPVPDFKLATEQPRIWLISEVTMDLCSMKL
ncbi:hypothetical protein Zmor_011568 [Zophobas morio]|uniref:Uncharacterized protein n=1 Tax=Zophobas morio TaxID=2755281 RepID=A0AA38ITC8_9CUCU|nr:hypothetical protein Zmor_011568 [Zophobas morio]